MTHTTLADLGWSRAFSSEAEGLPGTPARITAVHRSLVDTLAETGPLRLATPPDTAPLATGDWVLHDGTKVLSLLPRQSALGRLAAGPEAREQLIAANVTTLGIVTSCNADFNPARLERYLVLASEAGCLPLVILTKADTTANPRAYVSQAERLSPLLTAIALDATDEDDVARLAPWCRAGETLALVGSSGVGKTTLRNALTGQSAATQAIREDDAKGRHTTTVRELVPTRHGGWLIDTPGMRAVPLFDVSDGIAAVFEDIEDLAGSCRFNDCAHDSEPGCAVQAAIAAGDVDPERLKRWRKLMSEDQRNSESIAEARARDKGFGRMVKSAMSDKRNRRGD